MNDLRVVLEQLKRKRKILVGELKQLDHAIRALSRLGIRSEQRGEGHVSKRNLSAAARKRIAAAQKARWAKFRAANKRRAA